MSWNGLPPDARNIIKDVDKIASRSNIIVTYLTKISIFIYGRLTPTLDYKKIKLLLEDYEQDDARNFIQKYAETRLVSNDITISAFMLALIALLMTIGSLFIQFLSPSLLPLLIISVLIFIVLIIAFFLHTFLYVGPKLERYEAIIMAIEAAKLGNQQKSTRDIVELNKKDAKIICILILFIIAICQSFIILALISP